jgi:hypothetical protein
MQISVSFESIKCIRRSDVNMKDEVFSNKLQANLSFLIYLPILVNILQERRHKLSLESDAFDIVDVVTESKSCYIYWSFWY